MRICLVSRELAPYWGAGIGTYAAEMARAWAAAGHDVHILTAEHPPVLGLLSRRAAGGAAGDPFPGVEIHAAGMPEGPRPRFAFQQHAWAVYRILARLHGAAPFDYIEFPDYWAEGMFAIAAQRSLGAFENAVLGVRLHTPTRLCRELNRETWLDDELAVLQCAEERAIVEADAVISPTRSLLERCPGREGQLRAVVPYPFDVPALRALAPNQAAPAEPATCRTVLYFGRLERRKGVHLLIEAGTRLLESGEPLRFRFIGADTRTGPGGGSMREHLAGLVPPHLREHFTFEAPVPREGIAAAVGECIRGGGVCCFPSLWENFPNACIEAMALGAAVIGSDAGGMAEIIEHGRSGLLFRSGDAADLEAALRRALGDDALRRTLESEAAARVSRLCEPGEVVRGMSDAVHAARDAEGCTSEARPTTVEAVRIADAGDLSRAVVESKAAWILFLEQGTEGPDRFREALPRAIARNPEAGFIICLSADADSLAVPFGLEPELLPVLPGAAAGGFAVRAELLSRLPGDAELPTGARPWALACELASAGIQSILIPEPLLTGPATPLPQGAREAVLAALAVKYAPAQSSVPLRILAARLLREQQLATAEGERQRAEADRLRASIAEDQRRIAALEEQLASLRYRLADRANAAIKAAGVHGLAKAVARTVNREEPRP